MAGSSISRLNDKAIFDPGDAGEMVVHGAKILGLGDDNYGAAEAWKTVTGNRAIGAIGTIYGSFERPGFVCNVSRLSLRIESVDFDILKVGIGAMIDDDEDGRLIGPTEQGEGVGRLGTITIRMKVTIGKVDDGTSFRIEEHGTVRVLGMDFLRVTEEVEKIHDRDLGRIRCMIGHDFLGVREACDRRAQQQKKHGDNDFVFHGWDVLEFNASKDATQ